MQHCRCGRGSPRNRHLAAIDAATRLLMGSASQAQTPTASQPQPIDKPVTPASAVSTSMAAGHASRDSNMQQWCSEVPVGPPQAPMLLSSNTTTGTKPFLRTACKQRKPFTALAADPASSRGGDGGVGNKSDFKGAVRTSSTTSAGSGGGGSAGTAGSGKTKQFSRGLVDPGMAPIVQYGAAFASPPKQQRHQQQQTQHQHQQLDGALSSSPAHQQPAGQAHSANTAPNYSSQRYTGVTTATEIPTIPVHPESANKYVCPTPTQAQKPAFATPGTQLASSSTLSDHTLRSGPSEAETGGITIPLHSDMQQGHPSTVSTPCEPNTSWQESSVFVPIYLTPQHQTLHATTANSTSAVDSVPSSSQASHTPHNTFKIATPSPSLLTSPGSFPLEPQPRSPCCWHGCCVVDAGLRALLGACPCLRVAVFHGLPQLSWTTVEALLARGRPSGSGRPLEKLEIR